MSVVAEHRVKTEPSGTGGLVAVYPMIDEILVTGDRDSGVWSVHLNQWFKLASPNRRFEYIRLGTSQEDDILVQTGPSTGEALLEATSPPVHPSVGFYTSVGGFLDLHQELLPHVRSATAEQSRRLTEVLFRNKLVRRLE